jgi:hypothetical protein
MTLLEEINAKCPELIASRDHAAIAASVSTGRTKTQKVPIADIQAYLQTQGLWWAIKAVAADAAHPANAAGIAVIDVASARYDNIDTTLPIVAQMLGGLVATSVMTQAQMDDISSLGVVAAPVSVLDVALALENGV